MLLVTGNTKLIVDHNFYHRWTWLGGDPIEMQVGYPGGEEAAEYTDNARGRPDKVECYEVRYRPPGILDPGWTTVWKKTIGLFIIEAAHPWLYAAYVLLDGPGPGVLRR